MVPSAFVVLDSLPLTANGKINRRALPAPESTRPQLDAAYIKPETAAEQHIAAIWQTVLSLETVGIHDNFFELGGHSLLIAGVHRELQNQFEQSLSIIDLFQYPTIHLLAKHLTGECRGEPACSPSSPSQPACSPSSPSKPAYSPSSPSDIAIIGLSGRFSGAQTLDTFWHQLREGVE